MVANPSLKIVSGAVPRVVDRVTTTRTAADTGIAVAVTDNKTAIDFAVSSVDTRTVYFSTICTLYFSSFSFFFLF